MASKMGRHGSSSTVLCYAALILLLKPDYGFTRGRATKTRQVQYLACRYFPNCHTEPVKESEVSRGLFRRRPRCNDHDLLMEKPVVWKQR